MTDFKKKIINYVYIKEGSEEIENVRVWMDFSKNESAEKLNLDDNKLSVYIKSKINVSISDIEKIFTNLQKNNCDRINISLLNDVNCFLYMEDEKYYVKLSDGSSEGYKAELIEY